METSFLSTPAPTDTMAHSSPPTFLKLEDLDASSPQSTSPTLTADGTPAPIIVHSKAAKKRKSWGQELPEPTTNLPPRKRAKTTEEKEQRRIERIKRNRAAAHNSRERKRQETETLAVQLARAQSVIDAYRKLYGSLPADVVLPEVAVCIDEADTPAPSLVESRGSLDINGSPATTSADDLYEGNTITIKQEPTENTLSASLPPTFEGIDSKQGAGPLTFFDPTQHSAVSVVEQERTQPSLDLSALVGSFPPLPHDSQPPGLFPDAPPGLLDAFSYANGPLDLTLNAPLDLSYTSDFSFDDFINDSATIAADAGTGAA